MLKKVLISLGMVSISFLTGYATAQSFFLNKPATTASNPAAQNQNVMSPTEFQNQTEQIQKQKNEALSNQIKQNLAKVPPTPAPAAPTPASKSATILDGAQTSGSTKQLPSGAKTPSTSTAAPAEQAPAEASEPTPTAPANAPAQSDVYTGFQNDQNKTQSAPASGSGWNIQY